MTQHSRLSLVERAAEIYDFAGLLKGSVPLPVAQEADARIDAEAPIEAEVEAGRAAFAVEPEPVPVLFQRAEPGEVARIDRDRLDEAGFIVPDEPATSLAEEFRLVKRRLLANVESRASLPEEKRRTVLVTSGQPNEGKSFCAVNLALSLAGEREVDVLLVDGDFSKPEALSMLGVKGGRGLVDALADPCADVEDFVIRTDVPGLSVLPTGRKANNVPELLASDRTRDVFARLAAADRRRIILIDSPPALMASPATVLADLVGQVLIVVRADSTIEADLRETVALLSACDDVALLLNAASAGVTGRKYGGYERYGHDDQA
jgi:protein-tyrosine kinase